MIEPGVSMVKIEYIRKDSKYIRLFTIQVGSFKEISNAMCLKKTLEQRYNRVYITETYINGTKYHRVRIGKIIEKDEAYQLAEVIEMPAKAEAQAAINGLNGKELKGRILNVNEARPRSEGSRGGERRGGGRRF